MFQMNPQMMPSLLQMMQQGGGGNPFASPQGGMPPVGNMAPQIPVQQAQQGGIRQLPVQQPQQPQQPGGALGGAVNAGNNISSLYGMGNKAYNGIGGMFGPGSTSQTSTPMSGASNLTGQQNAQTFMGPMGNPSSSTSGMSSGMPMASGMPNYSGYGMAGPSAGGMYGGQQGVNAAFMNGGSGPMFGSMGATGTGPGGATMGMFGGMGANGSGYGLGTMGTTAGSVAGTGSAAGSSSPSWLSQLWDYL